MSPRRAWRGGVLGRDANVPAPHLVALQERPTQEVFDAAVRRLTNDDSWAREIGTLILRELGPQDEAGRRPFAFEAVPLLTGRLSEEHGPGVLGWIISAIGYKAARESLDEVLPFAEHPHGRVRFHVAAARPAIVNLTRSSRGLPTPYWRYAETTTRRPATTPYVLLEEVSGVDPAKLTQAITVPERSRQTNPSHGTRPPRRRLTQLGHRQRTRLEEHPTLPRCARAVFWLAGTGAQPSSIAATGAGASRHSGGASCEMAPFIPATPEATEMAQIVTHAAPMLREAGFRKRRPSFGRCATGARLARPTGHFILASLSCSPRGRHQEGGE